MLIKIDNSEVYFDEFPVKPLKDHKVFISHLRWLNEKNLPEKHEPIEIYTSQQLKAQLLLYNLDFPNWTISTAKITVFTPYEETAVQWENTSIQVLMCDAAEDLTCSVMFLIKNDNVISHFYTGGFTYFSYFFSFSQIKEWMCLKTINLYLYLERAEKVQNISQEYDIYELIRNAANKEAENKRTLLMFPRFGYENLIEKILQKHAAYISVFSNFKQHLEWLGLIKTATQFQGQNILIASCFSETDLTTLGKEFFDKFTCVAILPEHDKKYEEYNFTQIKYSTLPHLQHYQVLCDVKPQHIFGISNGVPKSAKLPDFIHEDAGKTPPNANAETIVKTSPIYKIQRRCLDYLDEDENSL